MKGEATKHARRRVRGHCGIRRSAWRRGDRQGWLLFFGGVGLAVVVGLTVIIATDFPGGSTAREEHPDLPGVDVAGLSAEQFLQLLVESKIQPCPCGCGFTLRECRHKDPTCSTSGHILDGMVRKYRNTRTEAAEIE